MIRDIGRLSPCTRQLRNGIRSLRTELGLTCFAERCRLARSVSYIDTSKIIFAWIESQTAPTNKAWKSAARAHVPRPDKATGSQSETPISVLFGGQLLLCPISPWNRPALVGKRRLARCKRRMKLRPRKYAADLRMDEALSPIMIRQLQSERTCYTCQLTY